MFRGRSVWPLERENSVCWVPPLRRHCPITHQVVGSTEGNVMMSVVHIDFHMLLPCTESNDCSIYPRIGCSNWQRLSRDLDKLGLHHQPVKLDMPVISPGIFSMQHLYVTLVLWPLSTTRFVLLSHTEDRQQKPNYCSVLKSFLLKRTLC